MCVCALVYVCVECLRGMSRYLYHSEQFKLPPGSSFPYHHLQRARSKGAGAVVPPPPLSPLPSYKPGCLQPAFALPASHWPRASEGQRRMSPFSSESAWLCLAATAVLGGMLLCKSTSPGQLRSQVLCLAGLWGGACLLGLSLLCSMFLLSASCFLLYVSSSDQDLLPVDQKAVLVTGKRPAWLGLTCVGEPDCSLPRWDAVGGFLA